jgi:aspartate aminotransferase-like enzyme
VNERHRRAAAATIAGAAQLGLSPWQTGEPTTFAPVVTTLRLSTPGALEDGNLGGILSPGNGVLRGRLIRVNHTGRAANLDTVTDALERIAHALGVSADAAVEAASAAY